MAELKLRTTERGFHLAEWLDTSAADCSIQESRIAEERRIWLGVDLEAGKGRMHLNREMVAALLPLLQRFVATGYLHPIEAAEAGEEASEEHPRRSRWGSLIAPWHVLITERDGTSHTVGLFNLDAVQQVVVAQLGDKPVAALTIQPNPVGAEDLATVLVELMESCPPSPQAQRAAAVLAAYDQELEQE